MRLKHLDLADRHLFQDPCDIRSKFRKTMPTWFFPVGEEFVAVLSEWERELEKVHDFRPDDPLFTKSAVSFDTTGEVLASQLVKECWAKADPI